MEEPGFKPFSKLSLVNTMYSIDDIKQDKERSLCTVVQYCNVYNSRL
jgi:hypothetical protein